MDWQASRAPHRHQEQPGFQLVGELLPEHGKKVERGGLGMPATSRHGRLEAGNGSRGQWRGAWGENLCSEVFPLWRKLRFPARVNQGSLPSTSQVRSRPPTTEVLARHLHWRSSAMPKKSKDHGFGKGRDRVGKKTQPLEPGGYERLRPHRPPPPPPPLPLPGVVAGSR